jgi:hypothetical protein
MSGTTHPLSGVLVGALLVLAGLYLIGSAAGVMAYFGWLFLGVGSLSVIVNLILHRTSDR